MHNVDKCLRTPIVEQSFRVESWTSGLTSAFLFDKDFVIQIEAGLSWMEVKISAGSEHIEFTVSLGDSSFVPKTPEPFLTDAMDAGLHLSGGHQRQPSYIWWQQMWVSNQMPATPILVLVLVQRKPRKNFRLQHGRRRMWSPWGSPQLGRRLWKWIETLMGHVGEKACLQSSPWRRTTGNKITKIWYDSMT